MATEIRREQREIKGEPVEVVVYDDGSERNASNGHWITPAPGGSIRTTERSHELLQRRHALARERAARGLTKGLGLDLHRASGGEEWELATEILARQFASSKNLRGMVEAYVQLGRATGYISKEQDGEDANNALLRDALLKYLRAKTDAIDGEVIDEQDAESNEA